MSFGYSMIVNSDNKKKHTCILQNTFVDKNTGELKTIRRDIFWWDIVQNTPTAHAILSFRRQ